MARCSLDRALDGFASRMDGPPIDVVRFAPAGRRDAGWAQRPSSAAGGSLRPAGLEAAVHGANLVDRLVIDGRALRHMAVPQAEA